MYQPNDQPFAYIFSVRLGSVHQPRTFGLELRRLQRAQVIRSRRCLRREDAQTAKEQRESEMLFIL